MGAVSWRRDPTAAQAALANRTLLCESPGRQVLADRLSIVMTVTSANAAFQSHFPLKFDYQPALRLRRRGEDGDAVGGRLSRQCDEVRRYGGFGGQRECPGGLTDLGCEVLESARVVQG